MTYATAVFHPYGLSHWIALLVFFAGLVALVYWGRRGPSEEAEWRFRHGFALLFAANQIFFQIYSMLPSNWNVAKSLPFQFSDLAPVGAIFALWNGNPLGFLLAYYWGLTLTPHSVFTPVVAYDFPHISFLMYWNPHVLMLWASVYLTWGLGYRPTWRGYALTMTLSVVWVVTMMVFNHLTGANYLFVSRKPGSATLLDYLGDWPLYVLVLVGLGLVVWALMTGPWAGWRTSLEGPLVRRRERARSR